MEDVQFLYKKKKILINFVILIAAIIILIAGFMSLQSWNIMTVIIFAILVLLIVSLIVYRLMILKQMHYFIKCTDKGIYTGESFVYCEWQKINSIELKRYMGYQTLFFQIDEDLKAKIKPIIRKNKYYYCLPLADCKGKPKEILEVIEKFKNHHQS